MMRQLPGYASIIEAEEALTLLQKGCPDCLSIRDGIRTKVKAKKEQKKRFQDYRSVRDAVIRA